MKKEIKSKEFKKKSPGKKGAKVGGWEPRGPVLRSDPPRPSWWPRC